MRNLCDLNYGIVGLGIMGGSIAKAIRRNVLKGGSGKILACNRSTACLKQSLDEKITDETFSIENADDFLKKCDFVFVCLYPKATVDFLKAHKNSFKENSIVTDISGVKGIFERDLADFKSNADFIIGHPMAGGEKEGYAASNADFFNGRNYILCPKNENSAEHLEEMRALIRLLGFARITETTCEIHDDKIGFTSQLCHIIASALVQSAQDEKITAFGGGSFEDLTRIAMINAPLWTELFVSNKEKLVKHIENFQSEMEKFKSAIQNEDTETLKNLLSQTREKRLKMGEIRTKSK